MDQYIGFDVDDKKIIADVVENGCPDQIYDLSDRGGGDAAVAGSAKELG